MGKEQCSRPGLGKGRERRVKPSHLERDKRRAPQSGRGGIDRVWLATRAGEGGKHLAGGQDRLG